MPVAVAEEFQRITGATIQKVQYVGGGDINEAILIHSSDRAFFLKMNNSPDAASMLSTESLGLKLIQKTGVINIPQIIGLGQAGSYTLLILEYIPPSRPDSTFWELFGQQLANLHRLSATNYGLDFDNYIGLLAQSNRKQTHWIDFYRSERLNPQIQLAFQKGLLKQNHLKQFDTLLNKLEQLLPSSIPALIHGDLWSGNFLVSSKSEPYLIDPAPYYGNREVDLAMTKLFGGFAPFFYAAYSEAFPLESKFEERAPIYQMYYLLVHLNLFGSSYFPSINIILNRYT